MLNGAVPPLYRDLVSEATKSVLPGCQGTNRAEPGLTMGRNYRFHLFFTRHAVSAWEVCGQRNIESAGNWAKQQHRQRNGNNNDGLA
jgi:hypothetical protein